MYRSSKFLILSSIIMTQATKNSIATIIKKLLENETFFFLHILIFRRWKIFSIKVFHRCNTYIFHMGNKNHPLMYSIYRSIHLPSMYYINGRCMYSLKPKECGQYIVAFRNPILVHHKVAGKFGGTFLALIFFLKVLDLE